MEHKYQLDPSDPDLVNLCFRKLIAWNTKHNVRICCYVLPMKGEMEFVVEQGNSEQRFRALPEAIKAYNHLS